MLRPRRSEDLERTVRLLRKVHAADRYPTVWPAEPEAWLAGEDCLGAWIDEDGEHVLGHLSLQATDEAHARPQWRGALGVPARCLAVVSRFFVAPGARGRGVGSALMDRAEQHAAEHGLRLALDVAERNRRAIAFYERRGWRRVGTAELGLSAEPWTLPLALFVRPEG